MQIFWVSGAVGTIKSVNLSFKTVILGVAVVVLGLVTTGGFLQFMGFRMALEYDPQIARQLGNLHTAVEVENLNAVYHARLNELELEHRSLMGQVSQLQAINVKLIDKLPSDLLKDQPKGSAQGGAYLAAQRDSLTDGNTRSVLHRMNQAVNTQHAGSAVLRQEVKTWQSTLDWLHAVPVSLPIKRAHMSVSSQFGERTDPITRSRAQHTGMDFELPTGMPILAAGAGVVIEAGWHSQYGQTLVIEHRSGYTSRYAHASQLLVQKGDSVTAGQSIAKSGSTGRATGPHLHFEILKFGKFVDPATYLFQTNAQR